MTSSKADLAWQLVSTIIADILSPLLLIALALFVSVGYIFTLLMPVDIDIWSALLSASIALPLIALSLRARRLWPSNHNSRRSFSWRFLLPVIPLLILLPPAMTLLALPSLNSIAHLDLYFGYVMQLFYRVTPIENVLIPGFPANHYWLFHAFNAAAVKLTSQDTFTVFNLLNFAHLIASLFWLARTIVMLGVASERTVRLGVMVIFVFGALNLTGSLSVVANALNGADNLGDPKLMLLEGADRRLHSIYRKLLHASGMTPGVHAFTAALYLAVRFLRSRVDLYALVLLSASLILCIAVMPVVGLFIALVLVGGYALTSLLQCSRMPHPLTAARDGCAAIIARIGVFPLFLWLIFSFALALPLLKYVDDFTSNYQSSFAFELFSAVNVKMTIAAVILLLPLAGIQVISALRRPDAVSTFFSISSLLGFVLALGLLLPDFNQYKIHYLLAMLLALAGLHAICNWGAGTDSKWIAIVKAYILFLVALSLCNAVLGLHAVIDRAVKRQGTASFEGIHVNPSYDFGGRLAAYKWIREHTPNDSVVSDSIVIAPLNYAKYIALFHERLNYVSGALYFYDDNIPEFGQRMEELHIFYDSAISADEYSALLESMETQLPGRPLYALVFEPELSRDVMARRGARLVFEHPTDGAHVYLLNPPLAD